MIIIVFGLPGTGKSYFALQLASKLSAQYVSSDKIRKETKAMGKYSFHDKFNIYREMANVTAKAIGKTESAVVDGTFYHKAMRDLFIDLAQFYKVRIFFIEIIAEEVLIKERLSKPRKESEANYKVYLSVKRQFEPFDTPHLILRSERNNVDNMVLKGLNYVKEEYESATNSGAV